jgi:hypothetical protein
VDQKEYRRMIDSLLYLTATRPDIQFSVCLCARVQASPRTSHQQAIKRIFRYLRYTPELGLWYSASSSLSLFLFFECRLCGVLSRSEIDFGYLLVFGILACFLVFSQIV